MQQYNIFLRSNQLVICDNETLCRSSNGVFYQWGNIKIQEILHLLETQTKINKLFLYAPNITQAWEEFTAFFEVLESAGGLVINESNDMLLIFRHSLWDLPKGKIEENEDPPTAAMREVNEECGITDLTIIAELPHTYHIYLNANKYVLKKSYWFAMGCPDQSTTPQIEEGIEQVIWIDQMDLNKYTQNMFASIRYLLIN